LEPKGREGAALGPLLLFNPLCYCRWIAVVFHGGGRKSWDEQGKYWKAIRFFKAAKLLMIAFANLLLVI
jgi:hypothetical protein